MKTHSSPATRRLMRVAQFSAIALASMQVVWAAGRIESVRGPVHIVDAQQNERVAVEGSRLEVRETLVTGASAEAVIVTDDHGLVHVRPASRYTIEAYRARGDASDTFIARLFGGGVRKISGWIARTAPDNVRLSSATTTIGIRGTDYEVQIVDGSSEPGTHAHVIDGAVSVGTDAGAIELLAGEHAVSSALGRLPAKRPSPDPAVFGEHALTAQVEQLKPTLRDAALQGPSIAPVQPAPAPAPAQPETRSSACLPGSDAQQVVNDLMRAYERGNLAELQRLFDPQVPGLGRMLDSATRERQQQIRVSLRALDQTAQCGADVASINFLWEKRSQSAVDLQPRLERGRAALLLINDAQTGRPDWRVVSIAGQNPFMAVLRAPPPRRLVEPPSAPPADSVPSPTREPRLPPPPTSTPPSTTPPPTTPPPTTPPPTTPPPSPPTGITAPPPPPPPTTAAP